jgi:ABC-2 type transport system permease protein
VGAAVLLVAIAGVGAGAGLLLGSVLRTEQQAMAVSLMIGLTFGAFGGAMVPIEIFSDAMRTAAHITPHAWALDGFAELVRRDGTLADILPELGVLAGVGAVLFALAGWRLRATISA